jgi:hypothetical protein
LELRGISQECRKQEQAACRKFDRPNLEFVSGMTLMPLARAFFIAP